MKNKNVLFLAESGIMIAFSIVLSLIPVFKLPFGGSVTAFSMLPIVLIAYRWGIGRGLICASANALIQLFFHIEYLKYGTGAVSVATILMLDLLLAFIVLGLAGVFKNRIKNTQISFGAGILFVCVLRFLCHFIAGVTVWRDISIPATGAVVASIAYNASYMVPEAIITIIAGVCIASIKIKNKNLLQP